MNFPFFLTGTTGALSAVVEALVDRSADDASERLLRAEAEATELGTCATSQKNTESLMVVLSASSALLVSQ